MIFPYSLFIDDERFPPKSTDDWIITRTFHETMRFIDKHGMPHFISFDHDLGYNELTGYDIAQELVLCDMNGIYKFPDGFAYTTHSMNPVGKKNIEGLLDNYFKVTYGKNVRW